MLVAKGIYKYHGHFPVLRGIDLRVAPGEIVAVMGASGAGKSTLLHVLATLDRPQSGTLHLYGQDVLALDAHQLAKFRNRYIGFVFQFHNLLPEFTLLENVCMPGYIGGYDKADVEVRAHTLLVLLGIAHRAHYKPGTLSGGEQQRAAVARALINRPYIVFADEPSGSLDSKNATTLHNLFCKLRAELNQGFLIATHNPSLAGLADQKLLMQDGSLVA